VAGRGLSQSRRSVPLPHNPATRLGLELVAPVAFGSSGGGLKVDGSTPPAAATAAGSAPSVARQSPSCGTAVCGSMTQCATECAGATRGGGIGSSGLCGRLRAAASGRRAGAGGLGEVVFIPRVAAGL
jgi:hypothetical protein